MLQQSLSLELRRKQGLFRLEAREVVQGPGGLLLVLVVVVVLVAVLAAVLLLTGMLKAVPTTVI